MTRPIKAPSKTMARNSCHFMTWMVAKRLPLVRGSRQALRTDVAYHLALRNQTNGNSNAAVVIPIGKITCGSVTILKICTRTTHSGFSSVVSKTAE